MSLEREEDPLDGPERERGCCDDCISSWCVTLIILMLLCRTLQWFSEPPPQKLDSMQYQACDEDYEYYDDYSCWDLRTNCPCKLSEEDLIQRELIKQQQQHESDLKAMINSIKEHDKLVENIKNEVSIGLDWIEWNDS